MIYGQDLKTNQPDIRELEEISDIYRAMGDYTRTRLLWVLMQEEKCVSDLACIMEVSESAISHQLRVLRSARLVRARKAGKNTFYSLNDEHVRWIMEKTMEHIKER